MVHQAEGERNFHIFYQMLTGGAPVLLNQVKLQSDPEQYFYLSQVGAVLVACLCIIMGVLV